MFGKKKDAISEWTKTGSFMHKPERGWLHSEENLREGGVCYAVKYVGCIPVEKSMRTLQYDMRQQVTREAILKCCETAGYQLNKRKKAHKNILKILGDIPNMKFSGSSSNMTISATGIKLSAIDTGRKIGYHDMQGISFASGGEKDCIDVVGYVAKDEVNGRACHVVDCGGGLAYDVINTIGQAFEIRYKMFLENPPQAMEVPGKFSEISIFEEAAEPQYNEIADDDDECPEYADPRLEGPAKSESHEYKVPLPVGQTSGAGAYAPLQNRTTQPQTFGNYDVPRNSLRDSLGFAAGAQYGSPHSASSESAYYENPLAGNKSDFTAPRRVDSLPKNIMDEPVPSFGAANGSHNANWTAFGDLPPPPPPMDTHPENQAAKPPPKPLPYALSKTDPQKPKQDSLQDKEWFHGQISRAEAELLLEDEGDFLVRESKRQPGQYVLSGIRNNNKRHLLLVDPEGKVRTKDKEFESVSQLVSFHLLNKVPIISAGSEVLITNPVIKG